MVWVSLSWEARFSRANWTPAGLESWPPRRWRIDRSERRFVFLLAGSLVIRHRNCRMDFASLFVYKLCPNNHWTYHKSGSCYHVLWCGQAWRTKICKQNHILIGMLCAWAVVGAPVPGVGDGWESWNFPSCLVMGLLRFKRRFLKGVLKVQREQLVDRFVDLKAERASQMDGAEQINAPDCSYHRSSFWFRVISSTNSLTKRTDQGTNQGTRIPTASLLSFFSLLSLVLISSDCCT